MAPRHSPYSVEFTVQAWHQIGQMPHSTFQALHAALDAIVEEVNAAPQHSNSAQTAQSRTAVGLVITYQRDDGARKLTVLDIRREPSAL